MHIIFYRLKIVYPALFQDEDIPPITPGTQAINQLIASIVTLVVALVGGALTGEYNQSIKMIIIHLGYIFYVESYYYYRPSSSSN